MMTTEAQLCAEVADHLRSAGWSVAVDPDAIGLIVALRFGRYARHVFDGWPRGSARVWPQPQPSEQNAMEYIDNLSQTTASHRIPPHP